MRIVRLAAALTAGLAVLLSPAENAAATPGSLEFGKCEKVAEGTGAFGNSACTKPGKTRTFQWVALSEPVSIAISKAPKSASLLFEGAGEVQTTCPGEASTSGALTASGPTGVVLSASGCKNFAVCHSEGSPEGVIHTVSLAGSPGVIQKNAEGKEALDIVGVGLQGAGGTFFEQFFCGPGPVTIRGGVIAQFPVNKNATTFKVSYVQEKGKQLPESFTESPAEFLEWSFVGAAYEHVGLGLVSVWKTVSKAKVELRHCEANVC